VPTAEGGPGLASADNDRLWRTLRDGHEASSMIWVHRPQHAAFAAHEPRSWNRQESEAMRAGG